MNQLPSPIWDQLIADLDRSASLSQQAGGKIDALAQMQPSSPSIPQGRRPIQPPVQPSVQGSEPLGMTPNPTAAQDDQAALQQAYNIRSDGLSPTSSVDSMINQIVAAENPQQSAQVPSQPTDHSGLLKGAGLAAAMLFAPQMVKTLSGAFKGGIADDAAKSLQEVEAIAKPVANAAGESTAAPALSTADRIANDASKASSMGVAAAAGKAGFPNQNIARQQKQLENRLFSALQKHGISEKLTASIEGPSSKKVVIIKDASGKALKTVDDPKQLQGALDELPSLVQKKAPKKFNDMPPQADEPIKPKSVKSGMDKGGSTPSNPQQRQPTKTGDKGSTPNQPKQVSTADKIASDVAQKTGQSVTKGKKVDLSKEPPPKAPTEIQHSARVGDKEHKYHAMDASGNRTQLKPQQMKEAARLFNEMSSNGHDLPPAVRVLDDGSIALSRAINNRLPPQKTPTKRGTPK